MATRYGVLPSSLLGLTAREWSFNILIAKIGIEADKKDAERNR